MSRRDGTERVRRALDGAAGGLSVLELAAATSLHENAVRRILTALVAHGDVVAERQATRSRGRPRLGYRLVGGADKPFRQLVPLLVGLLDPSLATTNAAYEAGRLHGEAEPAPGSGARDAVVASLVSLGFAPVERASGVPGRDTLDLTRCPFADAVTASAGGRQICHLHHGLLAGVAGANGGELDEFVINDPRVVPCRVSFHERAPDEAVAP